MLTTVSAAARQERRDAAGYTAKVVGGRNEPRCKTCKHMHDPGRYGMVNQHDRLCRQFKCRVRACGGCVEYERTNR